MRWYPRVGSRVKSAMTSPVSRVLMVASLLWMRAMISVRAWALPMPRCRSLPEWRMVILPSRSMVS